PVSAIAGAAELLEEEVPPEQKARFLANIKTESRRIQTLVDRMLALSSLEHRSGLEKAEDVDINKIIEAAVQASGREAEEKALQITITRRSESPVTGDAFLLEQAVSNLLRNAVEFSPQGGDITLDLESDSDRISLRISDRGPGIPDYAKEKIFDRFFSLRRPGHGKKSTGLGLNFVREIAHLHKGSIDVRNLPAGGAVAMLTLPVRTS
ncbi:MAG: ATP-binding protein, partial [Desulfobacterales bacterium]|nr:ATP-binding protein [Desulfobacterales bacterium]